jgi:hypothetical protein
LKANKVNLFVSSVLFVFWYHSPNVLDTPHICNISWLRVKVRSNYVGIVPDNNVILHRNFSFTDLGKPACKPASPVGLSKMSARLHGCWELTTRTADIS